MKRVCFFGASTIEGVGDSERYGWPGRLAILERARGNEFVCYNLGIGGQTLRQNYERALSECRERFNTKSNSIILLGLPALDHARYGFGTTRTPKQATLNTLKLALKELSSLAAILLVGPPQFFDTTIEVNGVPMDYGVSELGEASGSYKDIARELDIPFFDLFHLFSGSDRRAVDLMHDDKAHPTSDGYQFIADSFSRWEPWRNALNTSES